MAAITPMPPYLFPAAFTVEGLRSLDVRLNKPGFVFSNTVLLEYRSSKAIRGADEALYDLYNRDSGADKIRIIQAVFSKYCSSPVHVAVGGGVEARVLHVMPGMGHGRPIAAAPARPAFFGHVAVPPGAAAHGSVPIAGAGARPHIAPGSGKR